MATLYVYMNGSEVGEYSQTRSGAQSFVYTDSWLKNRNAIPVSLSLPLTDKRHAGNVVVNYFDNLLPDNRDIRERIQARVGASTSQAFDLLTEIGRDCVGAIQLLPGRSIPDIRKIEGNPLNEQEIARTLRDYKTMPLGMGRDSDFRISIAGAQEKTAFLYHENKWQRPVGATPTTHIFKLPIGRIEQAGLDLSDSVENEWLCLKILAAFGLAVADAEIHQFEDVKTLVVTRFDREHADGGAWIRRLPVEDMCQASGTSPALKYEADGGPGIQPIMELLAASQKPSEDRRHFMQSLFLFWLLGAIDGHAKNFSIMLGAGGRFQLASLYDVLSAYPLFKNRQIERHDMKMAMGLHGKNMHYKFLEIMPRHWYSESKRCSFPDNEMDAIIEYTLENLDGVIDKVLTELPGEFPEHIASPIFEGMRDMAQRKFDYA